MRKFGSAVVVLFLFAVDQAPGRPNGAGFDLKRCGPVATDIVLTDYDGRVIETWRGDMKPGEMLLLGSEYRLPANVLPWKDMWLCPYQGPSGWYHPQVLPVIRTDVTCEAHRLFARSVPLNRVPEVQRRLVFFLQKMWSRPYPYGRAFYVPAGTDGSGYLSFTNSIAWIEGDRVLAMSDGWYWPTMARAAANVANFKAEVTACPAPGQNTSGAPR